MARDVTLPTGSALVLLYLGDVFVRGAGRLLGNKIAAMKRMFPLSISLLVMGAFSLINANVTRFIAEGNAHIQVVAFLDDGLSDEAISALVLRSRSWPEVGAVRVISKEDAYREFISDRRARRLMQTLNGNPLPASLEVEVRSREAGILAEVVARARMLEGVSVVDDGTEWIESLRSNLASARLLSGGLLGGVTAMGIFIALCTANAAFSSRRREMEILKIQGLPIPWIIAPFLGEGIWLGFLAAACACCILPLVSLGLQSRFPAWIGWSWQPVILLIPFGGGLGLTGSLLSAKKVTR